MRLLKLFSLATAHMTPMHVIELISYSSSALSGDVGHLLSNSCTNNIPRESKMNIADTKQKELDTICCSRK